MGYIYLIRNIVNGKGYVGQTGGSVKNRFVQHKNAAKRGVESILCRAIRSYGQESFTVEQVCQCEDAQLNDLEKHYIESYETFIQGYNMTAGGEDWARGRIHSEETKKKIGSANKGRIRSREHIEKHAESIRGRRHSAETIAKMSEAHRGVIRGPLSDQAKANITAAQRGKVASAETRAKMSATRKGRKLGPMPEERRAKISATKRRLNAEGAF